MNGISTAMSWFQISLTLTDSLARDLPIIYMSNKCYGSGHDCKKVSKPYRQADLQCGGIHLHGTGLDFLIEAVATDKALAYEMMLISGRLLLTALPRGAELTGRWDASGCKAFSTLARDLLYIIA